MGIVFTETDTLYLFQLCRNLPMEGNKSLYFDLRSPNEAKPFQELI